MAQRSDLASLLSLLDDEDETVAVNAMAELLNREAELGDALAALIRRSQGRDNKTLADFAESLRKILEKFKF